MPIDKIIIIDIIFFIFEDIMFSIIASFEKNPDINGIPISAILVILITVNAIGLFI